MTEFKDKSAKQEQVTVGLFDYPVLMAADILLYGAKWVPVGDDQRQHVEFTRDLAIRMNNKFGELFVVPAGNSQQAEFTGESEPVRIRSLRDPAKKMSKSADDPAGTIMLSDSSEEAAKKIMAATTDSQQKINYNWESQPGIANLLQILALVSDRKVPQVASEWHGKTNYGELKEAVAEAVNTLLTGLQAKLAGVDETELVARLTEHEAKMAAVANQTLQRVQEAVGLRPKAT